MRACACVCVWEAMWKWHIRTHKTCKHIKRYADWDSNACTQTCSKPTQPQNFQYYSVQLWEESNHRQKEDRSCVSAWADQTQMGFSLSGRLVSPVLSGFISQYIATASIRIFNPLLWLFFFGCNLLVKLDMNNRGRPKRYNKSNEPVQTQCAMCTLASSHQDVRLCLWSQK